MREWSFCFLGKEREREKTKKKWKRSRNQSNSREREKRVPIQFTFVSFFFGWTRTLFLFLSLQSNGASHPTRVLRESECDAARSSGSCHHRHNVGVCQRRNGECRLLTATRQPRRGPLRLSNVESAMKNTVSITAEGRKGRRARETTATTSALDVNVDDDEKTTCSLSSAASRSTTPLWDRTPPRSTPWRPSRTRG